MAKFDLKIKAREMRKEGKSLKEIARILNVAKSTVSLWCRDIILTEEQIKSLKDFVIKRGHKGRLMGAEGNRRKKREAISQANDWAKEILGSCDDRDLLIAGIALYWAEGSKADSTGTFSFANSDPRMITLICDWMYTFFEVISDDLRPTIAINEMHEPRIEIVKDFWSALINIPKEKFKVSLIHTKQKKVYENYNEYYGLLSLRVKKGTFIRYKILALIEALICENRKIKSPYMPV